MQIFFNYLIDGYFAHAGLKDDPLAGLRSEKLVYYAWTDDQDIAFAQMKLLSSTDCIVCIDQRHDHFEGSVPVRGVILVFIVVIQAHLGVGLIVYSFIYAVKMMNHKAALLTL